MSSIRTSNAVTTLDDLLSYDDEHFIHSAYQILLGRVPDLEGMQHYLECVRTGTNKLEIISQLQSSAEGKTRGVKFDLSLPHADSAASSVEELMSYFDMRFVQSAYQTLLGRAPDAEGMRHYVTKVRTGTSRIQILTELHESAEGKLRSIGIYELKKAIRRHQLLRTPVLGRFLNLLGVGHSDEGADRRLRAIENELYALEANHRHRFAEMIWSISQLKLLADTTVLTITQSQQALADVGLKLTVLQQLVTLDQHQANENEKIGAASDAKIASLTSVPIIKPHDPIGDRSRAALIEVSSRLKSAQ